MNTRCLIALLTCIIAGIARAQDVDAELQNLAEKLASSVKEHGSKKVTVIDFTDLQGGTEGELGKYIAEQLTVNLVMAKRDFSVLDRANLRKILAEHKLTAQGLVDPENAKMLGKFAGVDALILGTIIPRGSNVNLTAKIITTETAEIVGAARAEFKLDDAVQALIAKPVAGNDSVAGGADVSEKVAASKTLGDIRVDLLPIQIVNGKNFLLSMTVTNLNSKKSVFVSLRSERSNILRSRITDANGTMFQSYGGNAATGITVAPYFKDQYAQTDTFSPATEIPPGNSVTGTVMFYNMGGLPTAPGTCSVQLEILVGHDFGTYRSSVSQHNFTARIPAK